MAERTALVTGGTAGIGFHTARALVEQGARVIVTGRHFDRGYAAVKELRRAAGNDRVLFVPADAASIGDCRRLSDWVAQRCSTLDVLVNNVGGVYAERRETRDGIETTLAVNFLAPFVVTEGLLPLLHRSRAGRIVNVVSGAWAAHKGDPLADVGSSERYVGMRAYAHAKLLTMIWSLGLARRLLGSTVTCNAVNPGTAWTPGLRSLTPKAAPSWRLVWPLVRLAQKRASAEKAARGPVHLASSISVAGLNGAYFEGVERTPVPEWLFDQALEEQVWDLGLDLSRRRASLRPSAA